MRTHVRIATVLYSLFVAVALVTVDLRYLLLATGCACLMLLVAGIAYLGMSRNWWFSCK